MKKCYSSEEKASVIHRRELGESVISISKGTGISRSTIYQWLSKSQNDTSDSDYSPAAFRKLENKISRLESKIEILTTAECRPGDDLKTKLYAIEKLHGQYSVHLLCETMNVDRGTFYNHIFRNKRDHTWYAKRKEELRTKVQKEFDDSNQIFGAAKITAVLKNKGEKVSEETVRKLMQDMGLVSIREGAKKDYDREMKKHKNYLNQQFDVSAPNEVWVSDVTCFRFKEKTYFICAILDLFARMVIGFSVGITNSTNLVKKAFLNAYESRRPSKQLTFHTDRGMVYQSYSFRKCLSEKGIIQSFSRAHIPYDNSVMESFFANLKREELYRRNYKSEHEFKESLNNYIVFYNEKRPHSKNHYKTPLDKEDEYHNNSMNCCLK